MLSYLVTQVYYDYSPVCKAAASEWEQAAKDLSQWARLGRIEWNQQYLLSNLRSFMGLAIRPDDLPVVFGFPTKCHSMACAVRCTCYRPTHAMPMHVYPKHMHACMFMIQEARVYWQCCVQQTMQILYASTIAVPGDSWQPFAHLLQTMQTRYVPSTAVPGVPLPAIASCHASIVFKLPWWLQIQPQYMIDSCELSVPLSSAAGTSTQHACEWSTFNCLGSPV